MDVRTRRIGVQKKGKHNLEAQRRGGVLREENGEGKSAGTL
jgi:hypothetical protein